VRGRVAGVPAVAVLQGRPAAGRRPPPHGIGQAARDPPQARPPSAPPCRPCSCKKGKRKIIDNFQAESTRMMSLMDRTGDLYDFGPTPVLWSSSVWNKLEKKYLAPRNISIWDAIDEMPSELRWYGEALLKYKVIPIIPRSPLFLVYHYDWQYYLLQRQGENLNKVKANYLGVIHQSNWESEMDYGSSGKGLLSRWLKSIKRFGRYLQSFL
jgi:hypothetical protein